MYVGFDVVSACILKGSRCLLEGCVNLCYAM